MVLRITSVAPMALIALLAASLGAAAPPPAGRELSPAETSGILKRLTLSLNPEALRSVELEARESWVESGAAQSDDSETDRVYFYHSVPLELEKMHNHRAL